MPWEYFRESAVQRQEDPFGIEFPVIRQSALARRVCRSLPESAREKPTSDTRLWWTLLSEAGVSSMSRP